MAHKRILIKQAVVVLVLSITTGLFGQSMQYAEQCDCPDQLDPATLPQRVRDAITILNDASNLCDPNNPTAYDNRMLDLEAKWESMTKSERKQFLTVFAQQRLACTTCLVVEGPDPAIANPARVTGRCDGVVVMTLGGQFGGNPDVSMLDVFSGQLDLTRHWPTSDYDSVLDFMCYETEVARIRGMMNCYCQQPAMYTLVKQIMDDVNEVTPVYQYGPQQFESYRDFMYEIRKLGRGLPFNYFASWLFEHIVVIDGQVPDQCDMPLDSATSEAYQRNIHPTLAASLEHDIDARAIGRLHCACCACTSKTPLTDVKAIAAGACTSVALLSDGTVRAWGANAPNPPGGAVTNTQTVAVQVPDLTNVRAIEASLGHCYNTAPMALDQDGSIWIWDLQPLTPGANPIYVTSLRKCSTLNGAIAISQFYILRDDGTVWDGWVNPPQQVTGLSDVDDISGALALKSDGTVWRIDSPDVQLEGLPNITAVAAGMGHFLALASDGTVWASGCNYSGQLGDGTTTDANLPVQVQGLNNVTAVAAGLEHSLALCADGTVWEWGTDLSQWSSGTFTFRSLPVQVQGLSNITAIDAGMFHSLALDKNGLVWAWGCNSNGELGNGTTTDQRTPVQVIIP